MRDQFISHHNLSACDEPTSVNICERLQIDISGSKQRTLRFESVYGHLYFAHGYRLKASNPEVLDHYRGQYITWLKGLNKFAGYG